jgi:hypothetical protein
MHHALSLFFPKVNMQYKMVWDSKLRRYVAEDAVVEGQTDDPQPLMDIGTRYEHLMALKDTWMAGVTAIETIRSEYRSAGDDIMLKNLEVGLGLLDAQLDNLTKFSSKQYDMRSVLNDIPSVPAGEYEKTQQKLLGDDSTK